MATNQFPPGWDEQKVRDVIDYYEQMTDNELAEEAEEALRSERETVMSVPNELVPEVRRLIARHKRDK